MILRKLCDPRLWPSRLVVRYLIAGFLVAFAVANYMLWYDTKVWDVGSLPKSITFGTAKHPIKKLMLDARARHDAQLAKRSINLADAAARYRDARGRHPPPGFDAWVQAALEADSIIVEDYFDRIYKDLAPFWALDTRTIAQRAASWHWVVKVRNSTAYPQGDVEGKVAWLQLWTDLVKEFADYLPDVDMPINYMDEPRLLVPHDTIARLVDKERRERVLSDPSETTGRFNGLGSVDAAVLQPYDPVWSGPDQSYWNLAVKTCGRGTPAHGVKQISDFRGPAEFPMDWQPEYSYKGFVQNWTAAMDPCLQPHLRHLHGTFIEPLSLSSTDELIPLFGGSKLPANNEILIPGAMYLTDDDFYSGGESHGPPWNHKADGLVWRGDASGGRARDSSWQHFQRHRLVDMLNATTVSAAEETGTRPDSFELPPKAVYASERRDHGQLGEWLAGFADAGFVHFCPPGECNFMDEHFHIVAPRPMKDQYHYKFLPDADGNSFSARFRGFLRSTSLPLKATVYAEWHDDRLIPWHHFVPLDNTFQDLYPVLEYFTDVDGPGDEAARVIAERGQEWAEKALRREDMRLYVWRLLLEWARVCDENRHQLGYVNDIE